VQSEVALTFKFQRRPLRSSQSSGIQKQS